MTDSFDFNQDSPPAAVKERQPPVTVSERGHYAFLHEIGVCAATGRRGVAIEVEHLSANNFTMGKVAGGMSQKPHFAWTIPLSKELHAEKTSGAAGYSAAFRRWGWPIEDVVSGPLPTALALLGFSALGDVEAARRWLVECAMMRSAR